MLEDRRRIVTGHDEEGRSIVVIDGPPGNFFGSDTRGLAEIWNTGGGAVDSRDPTDRTTIPVVLSPEADGTKFRYFAIPPQDPTIPWEELERRTAERFAAMGAAQERPDTTRHPGMHRTPTIDYIILLSGEVTLLLDEDEWELKPFDVVVQRGTNHVWINKGTEPALLIAVLMDAEVK